MLKSSTWKSLPALVAVVALGACGGGEGGEEGAEEGGEGAAGGVATMSASAEQVAGDSAGTIRGVVNFSGTAPQDSAIDMSEEQACADAYGEEGPTTSHYLVQNGKLGNVYVHVKSGLTQEFPTPTEPVQLDQENCQYRPHVLAIMAGQPLRITNSDPLLHNIQANPQQNRPFNISQPQEGMETTREFVTAEVMIPVKCDVHGWMNAYIGVQDHPYQAVSAEDGTFELAALPPGDYVVEAWHETLGAQEQNVTVTADSTVEVTFDFSAATAGTRGPLGAPLVVDWHGPDGPRAYREGETDDR